MCIRKTIILKKLSIESLKESAKERLRLLIAIIKQKNNSQKEKLKTPLFILQVYLQDTAMETWSVDQVCSWLVEKNLGELVHRFQGELFILSKMLIEQSRYWVSSVTDFFFPNACEHWCGVATGGNFHFFTDCSRVCIWPSIHEKI